MADSDKTVSYTVDANADGYVAAMQKAAAASKESAAQVEKAWVGVASQFRAVQGVIGTMLAVLAGGAAFKSAIDTTTAWGAEQGKLSKQLQITTAEAAAYQVAARHLGLESSALVDASDKMARQLNKNETAFKALGVETRNQNGSWRSTGELLPEVMDKLRGITNVTQQNIAGQQVFGKSWAEVRGLLRLSAEEMDKARQKVKDLNLEVDPKQVRAYKEGLNDIKLISTSLSVQMGNALLPALTRIGKFMGEEGPAVGKVFGLVLEGIGFAAGAVWLALKDMGDALGAIAAMAVALVSFDLAGFKAISAARDEQSRKNEEAYERMKANFGKPLPVSAAIEKGDGGALIDFGKAKAAKENILSLWEAQLEERKLKLQEAAQAEGRFAELSKADERAYWQAKLALTKAGSTEQIAVRKKMATLGLEIMKDEFQTQLAILHTEQEAYKHNFDARRALLDQEAALVAQKYGQHSKEYEAVQAKITALAREGAARRVQIEQITQDRLRAIALAQVDADQAALQLQLDLQQVNHRQYLQAELQLEDRRTAIKREALQQRLALAGAGNDTNPVEIARINAEIEALEIQHQARLGEIRNKGTLDNARYTLQLTSSLQSGFESVFNQIGTKIKSIGGLLQAMGQAVFGAIKGLLAKLAAEYLMNAIKDKIVSIGTAASKISANAAVAGAGGVASMAAAPFPLNLTAPEFGAAMSLTALSFMPMIASASGGYDIPGGLNPITQLHQREMVLPAQHADVIRRLASDGGGGGGGGGGIPSVDVHFHGENMGGGFWLMHEDNMVKALKRAQRNGKLL